MKRTGLFVTILVLVFGFAVPSGASTANLKSKLLTLHQLPQGWLEASNLNNAELPGCKRSAFPAKSTTHASVNFDFGSLEAFPQLSEVLASYTNVDNAFTTLSSGLSSCAHETAVKNGKTFAVTISKVASNSYGDQSTAFHVSIANSIFVDVLIVRKGDVLMEFEYGDNASISQSAFHSFSKDAVQKL